MTEKGNQYEKDRREDGECDPDMELVSGDSEPPAKEIVQNDSHDSHETNLNSEVLSGVNGDVPPVPTAPESSSVGNQSIDVIGTSLHELTKYLHDMQQTQSEMLNIIEGCLGSAAGISKCS